MNPDYTTWSSHQLITRIASLEAQLKLQNASLLSPSSASISPSLATPLSLPTSTNSSGLVPPSKRPKIKAVKPKRAFDPSKYSTRLIAIKFAYLGQRYNGFEHHANNTTPLPTIEEEMWKALKKTRLIFTESEEEVDWTGCEYSKCGRTDRGVSAFGQVIGIKVRSNRPLEEQATSGDKDGDLDSAMDDQDSEEQEVEAPPFDPIKDELPYIQLLNRVLPEDIRVLAWCPNPPADFSARFNCRERRYRYFFTQPAFAPTPGSRGLASTLQGKPLRDGWLDVEAMQDAAKRLEGLHDFRNFCKVDPAKQITNFQRRIFHASVEKIDSLEGPAGYVAKRDFDQRGLREATPDGDWLHPTQQGPPAVYSFNVNGSAFLWHQVRHLVAVIFMVGQGLEPPSIVSDLLNTEKTPTRPKYEMATDAPLVLWDCVFPAEDAQGADIHRDSLNWIYIGDEGGRENNKRPDQEGGDGKFGRNGVMDDLWAVWHQRKIDEVLAGSLLDVVASQGRQTSLPLARQDSKGQSVRVYEGGHSPRPVGTYVPVMQKDRMESVDVINARYAERKGLRRKSIDSANQSMDVDQ